MIEYVEFKQQIGELTQSVDTLKQALNIEKITRDLSELEMVVQDPDFWQDIERAQEIQTKINSLQKKLHNFNSLEKKLEDLNVLCELGEEEKDDLTAQEIIQEISRSIQSLNEMTEKMKLETFFTGEYDQGDAILTLHAGAGGTEAQDWTEMLYRMYTRWAEKNDFTVKVLDLLDGDEAGIKSCSFLVSGENAYGYLRSEHGVHRLVRISPFDASGRRHTSFASLEVIPQIDENIKIDIRPEDLRVDTYRSSGAGGQHVNKTESAIRITHLPTGVVVSCQSERSQIQNRETAMSMLKSKLFAMAKAAHMDKVEDLKGNQMDIAWGSQIRSYVFCPYTMVKDHRTGFETGAVQDVMDGELEGFMNAYLSGVEIDND